MVDELQELKDKYNADIIKVYFVDKDHYRVKVIKDGAIVNKIFKGIMPPIDISPKGNGESNKNLRSLKKKDIQNLSPKKN